MKITRITEENKEAFEDLFMEDFEFREDMILLGAVSDEKEAISCIALSPFDDRLVYIDWIYTDPAFREMGAATELLDTVTAILKQLSIERIGIAFTDVEGDLELFLEDHGFAVSECDDVYEVPISDLIYSAKTDEYLELVKEPKRLSTLDMQDNLQKIEALMEENGIEKEELEGISKKYSQVTLDRDGEPSGCLLIRENVDRDLEVLYFLNEEETASSASISALLLGLYRVLAMEEPEERKIIFSDPWGHSMRFVENLTGNEREEYRVPGVLQGVCLV